MAAPRMRLSHTASRRVAQGHPWIYRAEPKRVPAGTVIDLVDATGKLIGFALADDGPIAARVLGRGRRQPVAEVCAARIAQADALRAVLVHGDTDAYRVIAGGGDGLDGIVVDRYAGVAVLKVYSAAWEPHLEGVVAALRALPWCTSVLRRYGVARVDGRTGADCLFGPTPPEAFVVREHGMRMLVRPTIGQKTGLFLDQREHRALVRRWAGGRVVANLFGYNGGFSVAAALGGARRVVTVDIAEDALRDARENFRLNDLDPDAHGFEAADAFSWVANRETTLLIIDPPSLGRDKKATDKAAHVYRSLHQHHSKALPVGALLCTSSCTARVSLDTWRQAIEAGLSTGDWSWHWCSVEPPDHPVAVAHAEGSYLKFALLARRT